MCSRPNDGLIAPKHDGPIPLGPQLTDIGCGPVGHHSASARRIASTIASPDRRRNPFPPFAVRPITTRDELHGLCMARANRARTLQHVGLTMRPGFLLLILALAGCAAPGGETTPTPSIASATATPSKAAASDLPAPGGHELTGILGADSIEGGCTYLKAETAPATRSSTRRDGPSTDRARRCAIRVAPSSPPPVTS